MTICIVLISLLTHLPGPRFYLSHPRLLLPRSPHPPTRAPAPPHPICAARTRARVRVRAAGAQGPAPSLPQHASQGGQAAEARHPRGADQVEEGAGGGEGDERRDLPGGDAVVVMAPSSSLEVVKSTTRYRTSCAVRIDVVTLIRHYLGCYPEGHSIWSSSSNGLRGWTA